MRTITEINKSQFDRMMANCQRAEPGTISSWKGVLSHLSLTYDEKRCKLFMHLLYKFSKDELNYDKFKKAVLLDNDQILITMWSGKP